MGEIVLMINPMLLRAAPGPDDNAVVMAWLKGWYPRGLGLSLYTFRIPRVDPDRLI